MATTTAAASADKGKNNKPKAERVRERRRFVGGDKALLTIHLRNYKGGFLTYVAHKPAGPDAQLKKGFFKHFTGENARAGADAEFKAQADGALKNGWTERVAKALPASEFDVMPKAAPAITKPKATKKGGKK
jgi:hypothetical protein